MGATTRSAVVSFIAFCDRKHIVKHTSLGHMGCGQSGCATANNVYNPGITPREEPVKKKKKKAEGNVAEPGQTPGENDTPSTTAEGGEAAPTEAVPSEGGNEGASGGETAKAPEEKEM